MYMRTNNETQGMDTARWQQSDIQKDIITFTFTIEIGTYLDHQLTDKQVVQGGRYLFVTDDSAANAFSWHLPWTIIITYGRKTSINRVRNNLWHLISLHMHINLSIITSVLLKPINISNFHYIYLKVQWWIRTHRVHFSQTVQITDNEAQEL